MHDHYFNRNFKTSSHFKNVYFLLIKKCLPEAAKL